MDRYFLSVVGQANLLVPPELGLRQVQRPVLAVHVAAAILHSFPVLLLLVLRVVEVVRVRRRRRRMGPVQEGRLSVLGPRVVVVVVVEVVLGVEAGVRMRVGMLLLLLLLLLL